MSPVATSQVLKLRNSSTALQVAAKEAASGQRIAASRSRQVRIVAPPVGNASWWRQMAWPAAAIAVVGIAAILFQPLKMLHSDVANDQVASADSRSAGRTVSRLSCAV